MADLSKPPLQAVHEGFIPPHEAPGRQLETANILDDLAGATQDQEGVRTYAASVRESIAVIDHQNNSALEHAAYLCSEADAANAAVLDLFAQLESTGFYESLAAFLESVKASHGRHIEVLEGIDTIKPQLGGARQAISARQEALTEPQQISDMAQRVLETVKVRAEAERRQNNVAWAQDVDPSQATNEEDLQIRHDRQRYTSPEPVSKKTQQQLANNESAVADAQATLQAAMTALQAARDHYDHLTSAHADYTIEDLELMDRVPEFKQQTEEWLSQIQTTMNEIDRCTEIALQTTLTFRRYLCGTWFQELALLPDEHEAQTEALALVPFKEYRERGGAEPVPDSEGAHQAVTSDIQFVATEIAPPVGQQTGA